MNSMNKNVIINVGRQVCAGGLEIGRLLADEFQAKYYDRELLNLAAKESGFSEEYFKENDERKGFLRSFLHLPYSNNWGGSMPLSKQPKKAPVSSWGGVLTMCFAISLMWSMCLLPLLSMCAPNSL